MSKNVSDKVTGFFVDFDEWQTSLEDTFGTVEYDDNGKGKVVVELPDIGARQVYHYREDDDGSGYIFR